MPPWNIVSSFSCSPKQNRINNFCLPLNLSIVFFGKNAKSQRRSKADKG